MSERVQIKVENDDDAARICGVLEALGYTVVREFDGDADPRIHWACSRIVARSRLTEREGQILLGLLEGQDNSDIATCLGLSRATVKWHMHGVLSKTGAANREGLLRLALGEVA